MLQEQIGLLAGKLRKTIRTIPTSQVNIDDRRVQGGKIQFDTRAASKSPHGYLCVYLMETVGKR